MKIALIRPHYHSHLITPPLGLGYLASFLIAKGHNAHIIDGLNCGYSVDDMVATSADYDLIGITCLTAFYPEVVELSCALKAVGKTVVIGGPHASVVPKETLHDTHADYVIVGEAEYALQQLVDSLSLGVAPAGIPGVIGDESDQLSHAELIDDIDELPFPAWDQMDPRKYQKAPHGGLIKAFPVAPVVSTRGCPFECTFCASPFLSGRRIRFRSPENVVDEIEYLVNNFGVKEIHFEDDNLTMKKAHIEEICRLLIKRKITVHWATPNGVRADTLTKDLLLLMKESGCYFLAFGVESGNQEILDRIKKQTSLETIERAVRMAKKCGLVTQGFFIFGLPGETKETMRQTLTFAKRIPLDKAQFLLLDVLPGSELYQTIHADTPQHGRYRSYQEATWVPEGLTRADLNEMPARAFKSFFFRPRQLLFLLQYFKFSQIPFIIKRIADFNIIPILPLGARKQREK